MSAEEHVQEEVEEEETYEEFQPKVRWIIPQNVANMTFVGREVVAVAYDVYIMFLNLRTGVEMVYSADGAERGDGVDVITGHRTTMFAFAEKVKNPRIFIVTYPSFQIMVELKDEDVIRYKSICFMEGELIAGFSGFPNFLVTVWSWRLNQRLLALPTGIGRRRQLFMASRTHMLVCQCYGEGLVVWEVSPCYRRCFMMRRSKDEVADWDVSDPPIVAICWTGEGNLYACDPAGKLYAVASDGMKMLTIVEWSSEEITGTSEPAMCAFGGGILLYCPDRKFRWLKKMAEPKAETKPDPKPESKKSKKKQAAAAEQTKLVKTRWRVAWTWEVDGEDEVLRLVSSAGAEMACAWTRAGRVLRLTAPTAPTAPTAHTAPTADQDRVDARLITYKQRNVVKIKLLAPDYKYILTMNDANEICMYKVLKGRLMFRKLVNGTETSFQTSPVEPVVAVYGAHAHGANYGLSLHEWVEAESGGGGGGGGGGELRERARACLTHQVVSRVVFSPSGRELVAAAMSAGHLFIYSVSESFQLHLVRYTEIGRGLADCFLMKVGPSMRVFALVLFSDKFIMGERIICINAETGKDNKFAGKMKGPYCKLLPLATKDTILAIPHLSRDYHILKLSGEKGVTVSVKMGDIIDSGHALNQFNGMRGSNALLTFGADGAAILRRADGSPDYDFKMIVSHRYESGVRYAAVDAARRLVAHVGFNRTVAVTFRNARRPELAKDVRHKRIPPGALHDDNTLTIIDADEKNYLDLQEDKKVKEEAMDYKYQREEVVHTFEVLQKKLVELLEENIGEIPLHQLSLSEFNLHMEFKKERLKQAEKEREEVRLKTESRIRAQDKVTAWIKKMCWDTMLTPRVKIFAIFSHYQVENYPVLPSQRDQWPELQQIVQLRMMEIETAEDVFRPWEEVVSEKVEVAENQESLTVLVDQAESELQQRDMEPEEVPEGQPYVLSGTAAHKYITVPPYMIPQTLAFSYQQMNMLYEIVKYTVQNMRVWFNKKFDELMASKKRECGLVVERNARLRFILEELNKLSDLRGSFHHIMIQIHDPVWRQEEEPIRLTKVEVHECTIPPWKSHISLPPPELKPKDDFRERALNEMMDGVLEKLWHEEIKKPIPKPQCMLDKEPENWNEEDLRFVFDYEAKVKFRNEEREKYRHMLHAEYAKLAQVLNEGVVKFNMKVKEMWLTKLKTDSVIGQENLNLMRLRRINLDRVESAEALETLRATIERVEQEAEALQTEVAEVQAQGGACQAAYDALAARDRQLDRTFKNHFADYAPIIVDTCYKYFRKRPKWHQRATMIPVVLYELATAVLTNQRPPLLHPDCVDYFKGVEQQDLISNMPAIMDETLWVNMCNLRRIKIENEIRMRAVAVEAGGVSSTAGTWSRALAGRRSFLTASAARLALHREKVHAEAINRTIQLVLPAGQVEIMTTGHMEDFDDAILIPREDVEEINKLILRVGALKLRLLRRQIEFRKSILMKEWEHAQMKMKLRHLQQELYHYGRLKIVKELQFFLKNKELGYTDEDDIQRLEKEMAATKSMIERVLQDSAALAEELQVKISKAEAATQHLDKLLTHLHLKVSEKRVNEDALEPIRNRRVFKKRMQTLVARSALVREVQANHSRIVLLQTELELLRLKTFPTLAAFHTFC